MELRDRAAPRLSGALLAGLVAALLLAAPAGASQPRLPPSQTKPPPTYKRTAREVERISARAGAVRAERRHHRIRPTAYTNGFGRWQVSWFEGDEQRVLVFVDDRSGAILEQWRGAQMSWTMARGYSGAFGRVLNAPYVWLPLCALFLLPFVDPRRPFRLLHLDLVVLLGFGASHIFFNRGEIGWSVPLVYPVLVYLLIRLLLAVARPRARSGPLVPLVPQVWLVGLLAFTLAFRIVLNVADSNVIDVGLAGVVGADRIVDGDPLYGKRFSPDIEHGDTYGPLAYLVYVPFEQALPWSGRWDDLPAAHAAAIAFDLLTALGLLLLGFRLRPGGEGHRLGTALAYGWVAYPYTAYALETNSNDSLVALACVGALLALTLQPVRPIASAGLRALAVGAGAAAKFAPLVLAPLFAVGTGAPRRRPLVVFALVLLAVLALTLVPFLPDAGLREFYDRTIGFQAGRASPFSVWGQASLGPLQSIVKTGAIALALAAALLPMRRDLRQVAALGGAVMIALQLGVNHWFYLYIVWFMPFVLVALFAQQTEPQPARPSGEPERERALVGA